MMMILSSYMNSDIVFEETEVILDKEVLRFLFAVYEDTADKYLYSILQKASSELRLLLLDGKWYKGKQESLRTLRRGG